MGSARSYSTERSCASDSTTRDSVMDLMLKIGTPDELAIEIRRRQASLEMLQHYHSSWQQQLQEEEATRNTSCVRPLASCANTYGSCIFSA